VLAAMSRTDRWTNMEMAVLVLACYSILAGTALGTFTGLVPGVHVNTMALLMLLSYPSLAVLLVPFCGMAGVDPDLVPLLLSCAIVSAAVTHSFLDFIPSVFIGVPDAEECLSILPGHRLLLAGKGHLAVRLAAGGSLSGAMIALLVSIPLLMFFQTETRPLERMDGYIPGLLMLTLLFLIMSQRPAMTVHAYFRARSFKGASISLVPARPKHRVHGTVHGTVRRRLLGYEISTMQGSFPVRYRGRLPRGQLMLQGEWYLTRRRWLPMGMATCLVILSGAMGIAVLWGRPPAITAWRGIDGNMMFPLLTGLFGMPSLLGSRGHRSIPEQDTGADVKLDTGPALGGTLAGLLAGLVPGITSTSATVAGTMISPEPDLDDEVGAQRFIVMTAAVGTAAMVFGVLALASTGHGGTGALMVVEDMLGDEALTGMVRPTSTHLALLLLSVLLSSLMAFVLTIKFGRVFAERASGHDMGRLSHLVLLLVLGLCAVMCGPAGLLVMTVATLVGMVPPALGVSRVCLTGSLIIPLLLTYGGWKSPIMVALGGGP
jgi:TctA family transporter